MLFSGIYCKQSVAEALKAPPKARELMLRTKGDQQQRKKSLKNYPIKISKLPKSLFFHVKSIFEVNRPGANVTLSERFYLANDFTELKEILEKLDINLDFCLHPV